jgi:hypothetical protein
VRSRRATARRIGVTASSSNARRRRGVELGERRPRREVLAGPRERAQLGGRGLGAGGVAGRARDQQGEPG